MTAKVSIVIVNLDRAAMTLVAVESIIAHTAPDLHEIIVVDNGSAPEEIARLERGANSGQFRLIRLGRNMFFGEPSNIGAERAGGDYVLFLNNDVTVTPRWLDVLLAALDTQYRAGAVGPKILHSTGELLEAGAVVRPDGWGVQIGKSGVTFPQPFIDATRIADYCSGACLLMRRREFLNLGGFDPIFDPAYFEDADLAIRLRSVGLFTYYCGEAVVHHHESATSGRIWSAEQRDAYIRGNHARLVQRWGGYLRERISREMEPQPLAAIEWKPEPDTPPQDAVVLYSPDPVKADVLGRSILLAAAAFGAYRDIIIASDEIVSRCRIYSLCREFGIALESFRTRKASEIDASTCCAVISASGDFKGMQPSMPHLRLERDGAELGALLDRLASTR